MILDVRSIIGTEVNGAVRKYLIILICMTTIHFAQAKAVAKSVPTIIDKGEISND